MARQSIEIRGETVEEKIQSIGVILKKFNVRLTTLSFLHHDLETRMKTEILAAVKDHVKDHIDAIDVEVIDA